MNFVALPTTKKKQSLRAPASVDERRRARSGGEWTAAAGDRGDIHVLH